MSDQPLLGHCKQCNYILFATQEDVQDAESFKDVKQTGVVYRLFLPLEAYFARCDQRHKVFPLNRIKGTYSKDHKCDARCLNAKGHECTCACGGANHGRGHAAVHHVASVVKVHLGEIGKHIVGSAKVTEIRNIERYHPDNDSVLYTFVTPDGSATIKWFVPMLYDPKYEIGQVVKFRAKVKSHEDNDYGKATIVTYLEEIE
jgi:hypothetical protein